jgi:hypothetical protein
MIRLFRNKRALGTPVANLIILTAAVLLSITVVYFATNVTTSQIQKENVYITKIHLWYVNSSYSVGAISIADTGPSDIVLTKIVVKGLQITWNGTDNYVIYNKTNQTLPGDLPYVENFTNTASTNITIGNTPYTFTVAQEGLTLKSGWTMTFYIAIPNKVMIYDLGTAIRISISTTQAVYCTETLVQAA